MSMLILCGMFIMLSAGIRSDLVLYILLCMCIRINVYLNVCVYMSAHAYSPTCTCVRVHCLINFCTSTNL